ncbi:hypothetical protein GCM10009836_42310 [Pseudonocardia ailaonensis]|uniref:Uncharacterized protein n=1 Tax=Pseudonocardia ailaonensis TaxID=367279 RepID=A0ABN2N8I7_9PSEU
MLAPTAPTATANTVSPTPSLTSPPLGLQHRHQPPRHPEPVQHRTGRDRVRRGDRGPERERHRPPDLREHHQEGRPHHGRARDDQPDRLAHNGKEITQRLSRVAEEPGVVDQRRQEQQQDQIGREAHLRDGGHERRPDPEHHVDGGVGQAGAPAEQASSHHAGRQDDDHEQHLGGHPPRYPLDQLLTRTHRVRRNTESSGTATRPHDPAANNAAPSTEPRVRGAAPGTRPRRKETPWLH